MGDIWAICLAILVVAVMVWTHKVIMKKTAVHHELRTLVRAAIAGDPPDTVQDVKRIIDASGGISCCEPELLMIWDELSTIEMLTASHWQDLYKACLDARPKGEALDYGVSQLKRRARNDAEKKLAEALMPQPFFSNDQTSE
jgi:hypothetical protein